MAGDLVSPALGLEFQALVDSVKDYAIFRLDPEGHIRSWNQGARLIKGYTADEVMGRHFSMFYPEQDRAAGRPDRLLAQAVAEGHVEEQGWRVHKTGRHFWADVVITPMFDAQQADRLLGFVKVTRDLTEKRRAMETIREAEERLRLMIDSVRDHAIFMLDPTGRVASWNSGAERLKGYRADEIIGQHYARFYPPVDVARRKPEAQLQRAAAEGRVEEEGWRVRKDGTRFWASVVISAVFDQQGVLRGFAKVTRDTTERQRLAEELAHRAEQQAAVAELGLAAIHTRDLDSLLSQTVSRVSAILSTPLVFVALAVQGQPGQLRVQAGHGLRPGVVGQVTFDAGPRSLEAYLRQTAQPVVLEDVGAEARFEVPVLLRDHGARSGVVALLVSPEERSPSGLIGAFSRHEREFGDDEVFFVQAVANVLASALARDVADRRRREVERATAAERQRSARAEEEIRERDVFLTVAAHELRTPLTALQLKLEAAERMVRREMSQVAAPRLVGRLTDSLRQTDRLSELVERLLDVSRMVAGRLELQRTEVDLGALARQVVEDFREEAERARTSIQLVVSGPCPGSWDRRRLEQVVGNLLSNALKYGGGQPIEVRVEGDATTARLSVIDRGIGIAAQDLPRLFRPFERAAPVRHFGGLGIGLYITRFLAESHGGTVQVTSAPGEGTTFVVELPRRAGFASLAWPALS